MEIQPETKIKDDPLSADPGAGADGVGDDNLSAKDTFLYFSHDSNARHDENIVLLRFKHSWEGYGLYWAIIEKLREATGYRLKKDFGMLAFDLQTQCERIESIINDFGLFEADDTHFWSESLLVRMKKKDAKSEKARKSAMARWGKPTSKAEETPEDADAVQTQCEGNAINKIKENKKKRKTTCSPSLTDEQVLLIELLKESILKNNPEAKISPTYKNTWGQDLDKMMRLDKRTANRIREMIVYSQSDGFWRTNILSFNKLRKHFDKLLLQSNTQKGKLVNVDEKDIRKHTLRLQFICRGKPEKEVRAIVIQSIKRYGLSMVDRATTRLNHMSEPTLRDYYEYVKQ